MRKLLSKLLMILLPTTIVLVFSPSLISKAETISISKTQSNDNFLNLSEVEDVSVESSNYDTNTCGDNLTWHYEPAVLTISGTGAMFDFDPSSMEAPWSDYYNNIRTVVIEDGVTTIGSNTFAGCINLSSIEFPDSLVAIGDNAFLNCSSLSRLMIPDNVSYLGDGAFSNCPSISFVAMNSDAYNPDAFDSATTSKIHFYYDITYVVNGHGTVTGKTRTYDSDYVSLTITPGPLYQFDSMTINGVDIGFQAASTCITQDTVVEVTFVPRFPFSGTCGDNLTWMYDYDNATLTISGTGDMDDYANTSERPWNNLFWYTEKIVIENGVTSIGANSFSGGPNFSSISIPESVSSIGRYAFSTCTNLTELDIPNGVTTIGISAFSGNSNLERISIPEGVVELPKTMLSDCSNLAEVSLPETLTTIGESCFYGCSALTNIDLPQNITRIEEDAFYRCNSLTSIVLPDNLTYIGAYAFENCINLEEVRFPDNIIDVNRGLFHGCSNIRSITVNYDTYNNNRSYFPLNTSDRDYHFYVRVGFVLETNSNHDSSLYGQPGFDSLINGDRIIDTMIVTDADAFELPAYLESQGINIGTVVLCGADSSVCELTPNENGLYNVTYDIAPATYYTDPTNYTGEVDYQVGYLVVIYEECDHANVTIDQAVAPYCTTKGLTEGSHCSYCGEVIVAQNVIDALGHDVVIDAAVAPGCLTDGASQGSHCGRCYEILVERRRIPYTGHTPVTDPAVPATTSSTGLTEGSHCSTCGEIIVMQQVVPMLSPYTEGWVSNSAGWWYRNADGSYPASAWKQINGKWYYFNASGYMTTGWQKINNVWYYMGSDGAMKIGWQKIGSTWYYFKGSGAMVTGWQSIGGKWYFFNGSGAMQTGWQKINNSWYYFTSGGAMVSGWQVIVGKWYYFTPGGIMQTGWKSIGGKWYYFYSSGEMAANTTINGYTLSASGAMI